IAAWCNLTNPSTPIGSAWITPKGRVIRVLRLHHLRATWAWQEKKRKKIRERTPCRIRAARTESEGAKKSSTEGFLTKAEYLSLFDAARSATIAAVGKLSDDDLDRPTTGNMAQFAPTLGQLLILTSNHTLMHAGQLTVIRRALGKPVLF